MAVINTRRQSQRPTFTTKGGYAPHQIGSWVAVDERDYPWNTIGTALSSSVGKGTKTDHLMTAAEVLAATGLDRPVAKAPVRDAETGAVIPNLFTTYRDEPDNTRRYFAAVSDRYHVVQPRDALGFFDSVVSGIDGAHYSAAWDMPEKAMMGVTIELPSSVVVDPNGANDEVRTHILGVNSFDASTGLSGIVQTTRWFCMNQMASTFKNTPRSFTLRHTKNVSTRAAEAANLLGVADAYTQRFDKFANGLFGVTMANAEFEKFLEKLEPFSFAKDASDVVKERVLVRRAEALAAWNAPHNENITGTRWGALNVVGEWAQWGRNVNGSARTGTDATRQRAIGTLVHPSVTSVVTRASEILVGR